MSYTQGGPGRPVSREDRLCAELSISQAQLRRLERENAELRREVSSLTRDKHKAEVEYTRQLNVYKREYAMRGAQPSAGAGRASKAAASPGEDGTDAGEAEISLRYALRQAVSVSRLDSREEIERLKFFRNYFFEDFYSLDTEATVAAIRGMQLENELFMEVFKLFCCKKPVFDEFVTRALEMHGCVGDQVCILENVPVDWICDYIEAAASRSRRRDSPGHNTHANYRNDRLRNFIAGNTALLLGLLGDIAERRPETLVLVLSRASFDRALRSGTAASRRLVSLICRTSGGHLLHLLSSWCRTR